jgi:hypothetical protein
MSYDPYWSLISKNPLELYNANYLKYGNLNFEEAIADFLSVFTTTEE